jgi:dolichol-phosphate mannosyltransferase
MMSDDLIMIPTYNERDNIVRLVEAIRGDMPEAHVLVIDDGSPDGTADYLRSSFDLGSEVHLIEREGKQGLGSAYRQGMRWGLDRGYERFFSMDADFSHPPERLPAIRSALDDVDCVVGSRYVEGGGIQNWGWFRRSLSASANVVARSMIGLSVNDCTSGFRGYRREILERVNIDRVKSEGYVFLVEMVTRVKWNGGTVEEIPFQFVDRRVGQSKINRGEIIRGFFRVLKLMFERFRRK